MLRRRLQCYSKLRGAFINLRDANAFGKEAHPARADVMAVNHCDDANVGGAPPIFCIYADVRPLQDLERPETGGRRIPQSDVQSAPEAVLILGTQRAKPDHFRQPDKPG